MSANCRPKHTKEVIKEVTRIPPEGAALTLRQTGNQSRNIGRSLTTEVMGELCRGVVTGGGVLNSKTGDRFAKTHHPELFSRAQSPGPSYTYTFTLRMNRRRAMPDANNSVAPRKTMARGSGMAAIHPSPAATRSVPGKTFGS